MNDSHNTDNGASGTPENSGTSANEQRPETMSSDATPTENLSETTGPSNEATPTVDLPRAHTLPHRTGPTPPHFVHAAPTAGGASQARDDSYQAYDAAGAPIVAHDPAATTGYDGYQGRPAASASAQAPYAQAPYGQTSSAQGASAQGAYAQAPYGQSPYGAPYGPVPTAFARPKRRPKRWMVITGAAAATVIVAGAAGGAAFAIGHATGEQAASAAGQNQTLQLPGGTNGSSGGSSSGGTGTFGGGTGTFGGGTGTFGGGTGTGGTGGSSTGTGTVPSDATAATSTEKKGLVTIVSTLDYNESSKSAGTGMIMTSDGRILTNNHVVQGATSITVTDETTGKSYTAKVVGTDATNDVAVLQLENASGLSTVSFDKSTTAKAGDSVHSTGNAEGTGNLVTAKGTVVATNQAIQVQSESGTGTESLSNLIEISADVVSGDSGGPLRNANGDVIGIVTAASSGTSDTTGYAIPISSALSIASKIVNGESSDTIVIGLPAFLGAQISSTDSGTGTTAGVPLAGTVTGSAAAKAGLVAGDTITAVDGTAVADGTALTKAIQSHKVGDSVKVTYTDASGASHTVTVVLGSGPAA